MSSEGLPVNNVVGTSVDLGARSVQDAANSASSSQNADSAAASADAAWKFSRVAQGAAGDSASAVSEAAAAAAAAAEAAQNATIAANIYPSVTAAQAAITAGTIPLSAMFNVAVPAGSTPPRFADQYQNVAGVATPTGVSYPSSEAVNESIQKVVDLNQTLSTAFTGVYQYNGALNITALLVDTENRLMLWIDHDTDKLMFRGEATQSELTEETFSALQDPVLQPKFASMYEYNGTLNITAIITDVDGRLIFWIDHNTNKLMFRGQPVGEAGTFITPGLTLEAIGDSQTNGVPGSIPWRTQIVGMISPRTIRNWAIGGQTSGMITSRLTVHNPLLTITGNLIPAGTTPVAVTDCKIMSTTGSLISEQPLTTQGYQQMSGILAGVPGVFARISDGSYTFTRTTVGSATECWPNTQFVTLSASPGVVNDIFFHLTVIGIGRNDVNGLTSGNYAERLANLKYRYDRIIQRIETAEKRYILLAPMTAEGEPYGSLPSNFIIDIENYLQDKYGSRVLNQRTYSFKFGDGGSIDNGFIADGIPPASVRVDNLHFNTFYQGKIAEWIANQINTRGW